MEELLEEKKRSEQKQEQRPRPRGKAAEMEDLLESSELALEKVAEDDGLEMQDTEASDLAATEAAQAATASNLGASPSTKDMGGGVIKMFNEVKRDLEKEIKIAEHAEK